MKKTILLVLTCLGIFEQASAQQPLKDIRKKSLMTYVYRIPADTAEKYVKKGIKTADHYLDQPAALVFPLDSINYEKLPVGNYLFISVIDNELLASYHCQTNVRSYVVNNQVRPQLILRNDDGGLYKNALVTVDGKQAIFNENAGTYSVKQKEPEDAVIKMVIPGDTSFAEFSVFNEKYRSVRKQRWTRFSYTRVGRVLTWLPNKISYMFKTKPRNWFRKRYRNNRYQQGKGYMLFSKPKYFPSDTVRFKAYLLDKKGKQYKDQVEAWLSYYNGKSTVVKKLAGLKPVSAGAYVYEFNTGDTLGNDRNIQVLLKSKKNRLLLQGNFYIEDYLLDEVAIYKIESKQPKYFAGDTIQFMASAKDANGLPLMDGKVKLVLLNESVDQFSPDREFIPDTLWQEEKALAIEGDTKFIISTAAFPKADLQLKAKAIFRNSNNEIQEENETVAYKSGEATIDIKEQDGLLIATYYENGKPAKRSGWMETDLTGKPVLVEFPHTVKIDPMAETYEFYIKNEKGSITEYNSHDIEERYTVGFSRMQEKDTIAFALSNPNKVPVYYSIFDGDKSVFKASSDEEWITWKSKMPAGKSYRVKWEYYWGGEEKHGAETIALLSKLLSSEIRSAATVYPGQTDTITVAVKDYKKREAKGVNITAVSYNAQFGEDIRVPEPPYIQKFRGKTPIQYNQFETEEAVVTTKFLLGQHPGWRQKFELDTMPYYQLLFPVEKYQLRKSRVQNILPQVSVFAVKQGVPQEIYLLYINRELVYYNGITDKGAYAFTHFPGYVQIGIRLKDKYIEYDSIYLQPYYKHDIFFDIDKVAAKDKVKEMPLYWDWQERNLLENKMLRIENNYRNNYGYVWQDDKIVFLGGNNEHVIGPFMNNDSIQFYKPGDFDFKFIFEPGYRYRVTPKMVRLEKIPLFPNYPTVYLPERLTVWTLGDTIPELPGIKYDKTPPRAFLEQAGYNAYYKNTNSSRMMLKFPADSTIAYTILYNKNVATDYKVLWGPVSTLNNIAAGTYSVIIVTRYFNFAEVGNINISTNGTYCVRFNKKDFTKQNYFIDWLLVQQEQGRKEREEALAKRMAEEAERERKFETPQMNLPAGSGTISGRVIDTKGKDPVASASVRIKGYNKGASTNVSGDYTLQGIKGGAYVLQFSAVGYEMAEVSVSVYEGGHSTANASLNTSTASLEEVVVVGYGVQRQSRELSYSVSKVSAEQLTLTQRLEGKVAGLNVQAVNNGVFNDTRITLRGIKSVTADSAPLIIIDGIPVDAMPADLDPSDIASTSILKDAAAVALYGARAAGGVIIITTKAFNPKMLREQFRDYAFWKPNLITDENGEVKFAVTYPDNITSWKTYVVGMDKKRRITKTSSLVKAFKPMLAQLSAPQFLVEADTAVLIGKKINYTNTALHVDVDFSVNGQLTIKSNETLAANNAGISELGIAAGMGKDTLRAQFTMKATNGFTDGELRSIPVIRKGTTETVGDFYLLEKDTTVSFSANSLAGNVKLYAQNNTLDLLLDEIEYLKKYPYYCMEQTASKLAGLAMEKKIRAALNQAFGNEKEMKKLLEKLQKGQLFEGGWSWWEGGRSNLPITNYITRALLELRGDALLETNIRNALLYLQNQLPRLHRYELLETLYTLSEAGHDMDYGMYLRKIPFDSLTQHQQWQMTAVLQQQKLSFDKELKKLMDQKTPTMLGGLHWGTDTYWWNSNRIATTVIACKLLGKLPGYENETRKITQYFLEMRKEGHWRNTVESASILSAILPKKLEENKNFTRPAGLTIKGDTSFTVTGFPFSIGITDHYKQLSITKSGGGLVYFTAYQQLFNPAPLAVDSNFSITTYFENSQSVISSLKAGEKVTMKVVIDVKSDADFVQVEIPIPAGCTYGKKGGDNWNEHREYYKDRVMVFAERMSKGKYTYEIELEPRYSGRYTINPAKAELMYFPVFYGRNNIQKIEIKK